MFVTKVALPNKANVLLLEKVLPVDLLADLHNNILDQWTDASTDWKNDENSSKRWQYIGNHPTYNSLEKYMSSPEMCARLQGEVQGCEIEFSYMKLLLDLPGYGPLLSHLELAGEYVGQIYFTRTPDPYHGTKIGRAHV